MMNKSQILLSFLQKNCALITPVPTVEKERFEYYKGAINKLPPQYINESFLKIEDVYLTDTLQKEDIVSVEGLDALITVSQNKAAFFSADAVLSFLNDGSDKSIYLYGGTRLKTAVAHAISGKDIAVTKANNVKFSGVISAQLPSIDLKLTSVILKEITDKYTFALDVAMNNKLKTLVLTLPNIENAVLCSRVADAILGVIKQHVYTKQLKIVLSAPNSKVFDVYKSKKEVL